LDSDRVHYKIKPCVGCGYCCLKAPCFQAVVEYELEYKQTCPGLTWDDEKVQFRCKLMMRPGAEGKKFRDRLAVGGGCSSSLFNNYRDDFIIEKGGEES